MKLELEPRLPDSHLSKGVCAQCVNSQELKTKSPNSDSSTHSHGGDSPATARAGICPSTFPPPGLAAAGLLTRVGRRVQRRGKRKRLQHLYPGLSPNPRVSDALRARAPRTPKCPRPGVPEGAGQESGAEGGSGAWGPGGRHRLGSSLQILQVTLSFMGNPKKNVRH